MKLNERITRWRDACGITKAELARRVGVSPEAVTQWENEDGTTPTHDNVEKIAAAVHVSLSDFWGTPPRAKKAKAS